MADKLAADAVPVIDGGKVDKQPVFDRISTPAVKIADAIPDGGFAVMLRADMDAADFDDADRAMEIIMEVADDVPGAPDEKLEWTFLCGMTWQGGGEARPDRPERNPMLGVYGPELKGKRLRSHINVLGPPINIGSDYKVSDKPVVAAAETKP